MQMNQTTAQTHQPTTRNLDRDENASFANGALDASASTYFGLISRGFSCDVDFVEPLDKDDPLHRRAIDRLTTEGELIPLNDFVERLDEGLGI